MKNILLFALFSSSLTTIASAETFFSVRSIEVSSVDSDAVVKGVDNETGKEMTVKIDIQPRSFSAELCLKMAQQALESDKLLFAGRTEFECKLKRGLGL